MDTDKTRISLLSRVRNTADDASWLEFENRYRDLILRYAMARGVQHADADDICQVVMMNLARSLRSFQYSPQRGRFRDYLGRVVRNAVARQRLRPNPTPIDLDTVEGAISDAASSHAADAVWEQEWVDHHYRLALQTIRETFDPKSVEVFQRLIEGMSVAEVAASFGTTEQAVHKVKQRIRVRMEELIAIQVCEEDEPCEFRDK